LRQPFFWACGPGDRLAQQLILHRLLAEKALELTHLRLKRTILCSRHHLAAGGRGGERALRHQPAPGEELVASNAVAAGDKRYAHPRQIGLLDDPDLLLRCPAPPALDTGDDLHSIITPRNIVSHMRGPVRRFRGLLHAAAFAKVLFSQPVGELRRDSIAGVEVHDDCVRTAARHQPSASVLVCASISKMASRRIRWRPSVSISLLFEEQGEQ
jgi:hypothetical protein